MREQDQLYKPYCHIESSLQVEGRLMRDLSRVASLLPRFLNVRTKLSMRNGRFGGKDTSAYMLKVVGTDKTRFYATSAA
jgi:hypothetical protein